MATQLTTTGAQQRASDFENAPSRRGLLLMAAATAVAGSAAVQANVGQAEQGVAAMNMHTTNLIGNAASARWDRAFAAMMRAKREYDAHSARWVPYRASGTSLPRCGSNKRSGRKRYKRGWATIPFK